MRETRNGLLMDPRTRRLAAGLAAVVVLALVAGVVGAQSSGNYNLWWYTMDSGNGLVTGAQYGMAGTLGESLSGQAAGRNFGIAGGYEPAVTEPARYHVYLPVVFRVYYP